MSTHVYAEGVLREKWDDTSRTYTSWDATGAQTSTRAYTAEENARADAEAATALQDANRASIEDALATALAELQAIVDTANSTINGSPASYIKTLARAQRRVIRLVIRRFDGTS